MIDLACFSSNPVTVAITKATESAANNLNAKKSEFLSSSQLIPFNNVRNKMKSANGPAGTRKITQDEAIVVSK